MIRAIPLILLPILLAAPPPLARYNEGVASLEEGKLEAAIGAFEAAAVEGEGRVRADALLNLGICHAKLADAIRDAQPGEEKGREDRIRRLGEAAEGYRRALALFRRVPPPAPDAEAGAAAAKVRLLATLDELQKLMDEAKRDAEEQALSDPAAFLLATLTGERDRRRAASRLEGLDRRRARLPARRLRRAEYEARGLVERLASRLSDPPGAQDGAAAPGSPPPIPQELARQAAEHASRAARAMAAAEGHLAGRDATGAVGAQGRAVSALAAAAAALPAPLPALVAKLIGDQQSLLDLTRSGGLATLPAEQREVRGWLETLARLPDPPAEPQGGASSGAPEGGRLLADVVAKIRELGAEAAAAAERSAGHLEAGRLGESKPEQELVTEKLEEIRELLPKPPESPADRIRKLLAEELEVKKEAGALPGLNPEARAAEETALGDRQTENGRMAGSIAGELEGSPGDREKRASEEVRKAETEIHDSAEALRRDRVGPAVEAIDRAAAALEEALRILSGQDEPQGGKDGDRQQDQDSGQGRKPPEKQDVRELDAAEARRRMEQMDRERREEEKKLFGGVGGPKVEKDW